MHDRPLEECDRIAHQTGLIGTCNRRRRRSSDRRGRALDNPARRSARHRGGIRTIRKIGHCYGYSLGGVEGRKLVLGILSISLSGSLDLRRQRLRRLRDLEEMVAEQTEEEVFVQEIVQFVFQLEIFEEVPGLGAMSALC